MSKTIDRDRSEDCEAPEVLTVLGINSKCVDLSWPFDKQSTVYWPGGEGFNHCVDCSGNSNINGNGEGEHYASGSFSTAEHGGTHVDAPYHFARDGVTIEKIRMKDLIAPCCVIDISSKQSAVDMDPENKEKFSLSVSDIEAYELEFGSISVGCIVLVRTGWSQYWMDGPANYLGYDEAVEGPFDSEKSSLSFPGISPEAAHVLISRKIVAVGLDTPSLDSGANSKSFPSHRSLLGAGIYGIENINSNIFELPPRGCTLFVFPMKINGATGSPTRLCGIIPNP